MQVIAPNIISFFDQLRKSAESIGQDVLKGPLQNPTFEKIDSYSTPLFTDHTVNEALYYLKTELENTEKLHRDVLRKCCGEYLRNMDLLILLFSVYGQLRREFRCIKIYQLISKEGLSMTEKNYARSLEALFYLVNDNTEFIPEKVLQFMPVVNKTFKKKESNRKSFIIELACILCQEKNPNINEILDKLQEFKENHREFFNKCSLDSHLCRIYYEYYSQMFKNRAVRFEKYYKKSQDIEMGFILKKLSIRIIEYYIKSLGNVQLYTGSYEKLFFLWHAINFLLKGSHIVAESYTMMGIERELLQYQSAYFKYASQFCVPYRIKLAIHLAMHTDFTLLRSNMLKVKSEIIHHINTSTHATLYMPNFKKDDCPLTEDDPAKYQSNNSSLAQINDEDEDNLNSRVKRDKSPLSTYVNKRKRLEWISFEKCFLQYAQWSKSLVDIHCVIKEYIWELENSGCSKLLRCDNKWQQLFIDTLSDNDIEEINFEVRQQFELNSSGNVVNIENCQTPSVTPHKRFQTPKDRLLMEVPGAPRLKKVCTPRAPKKTIESHKNEDEEDYDPIETINVTHIPYVSKNIKYEQPEIPRSFIQDNHDVSNLNLSVEEIVNDIKNLSITKKNHNPKVTIKNPNAEETLISYLESHVKQFKFYTIPVLYRPITQRLALHYLAENEEEKAGYYFSLSVNIGFRQLYHNNCMWKIFEKHENRNRWSEACSKMNDSLVNETKLIKILETTLPVNWTIIQLTMIDEIPCTSVVKSSLCDYESGGCMGARNVALLVATKFTNISSRVSVQSRVLKGFKHTGLQLIDKFEELKSKNTKSLLACSRREWWRRRFDVDSEFYQLLNQMSNDWLKASDINFLLGEPETRLRNQPKILVLDKSLNLLPWEILLNRLEKGKPHNITRMPSVSTIIGHLTQLKYRKAVPEKPTEIISSKNLSVNPDSTFYVVNPDQTLSETEASLLPVFRDQFQWKGIVGGAAKSHNFVDTFQDKDLIVYCGHGTGNRYLMQRSLKYTTSNPAVFLIGCHSARFIDDGRSEAYAHLYSYLSSGCPSVVGLLWDVTDREIDKFTISALTNWLENSNSNHNNQNDQYQLSSSFHYSLFNEKTSEAVKLKTITACSCVVFGLPIWKEDRC